MSFTQQLLAWFDDHGRKDLPWQQQISPYRVWISEIMLQQTQVSTVIPYFQRFMERFPDINGLAKAPQDEVLALWTGLGYYARARNLHKAAQLISEQYQGRFPETLDEVVALPGIGRSTAGAILSISHQQRHPILDGNVKRVLTRYHAIQGWPGQSAIEKLLWQRADEHTPKQRNADYTQAIMDLGATLCRRSKPACPHCPVQAGCQGFAQDLVTQLPTPKPKKQTPVRSTVMLLVTNTEGHVLLQQRPPSGIWGGLWSFPELDTGTAADIEHWCQQQLGRNVTALQRWPALRHTFSHFHLDIKPVVLRTHVCRNTVRDDAGQIWHPPAQTPHFGLATPVKQLLEQLDAGHQTEGQLILNNPDACIIEAEQGVC